MKNAIKNAGKNTSLAGPKGVFLQLKLVFMSQIKHDWHGKIERAYFLPISYVYTCVYFKEWARYLDKFERASTSRDKRKFDRQLSRDSSCMVKDCISRVQY